MGVGAFDWPTFPLVKQKLYEPEKSFHNPEEKMLEMGTCHVQRASVGESLQSRRSHEAGIRRETNTSTRGWGKQDHIAREKQTTEVLTAVAANKKSVAAVTEITIPTLTSQIHRLAVLSR